MYLGSFVLILSTILITFTTSVPVFNEIIDLFGKITGNDFSEWHRTSPLDPIAHYNRYQLWIAVLIGLMAGTDRKSTRLNSSHVAISYAVFCLKKKKT